jgi:hypothetical protein
MKNNEKIPFILDDYAQIISLLSKNIENLNKVLRFKNALEQLKLNQKKLTDLYAIITIDIAPIEAVKLNLRKDLEGKTMQIIRIMQIYAYDKKKKNLQKQLECLTTEYVKNSSDLELIKIAKKIWTIANKNEGTPLSFSEKIKASLNPDSSLALIKFEEKYGLTPKMIKNIEIAILKFIDSMHPYNSELKKKEKAFEKIKLVNKQNKKLLENNIDHYILLFELENPKLYKEYRLIRENKSAKTTDEPLEEVKTTETTGQESEMQNLVVAEDKIKITEPKSKPKTAHKANSEEKNDL